MVTSETSFPRVCRAFFRFAFPPQMIMEKTARHGWRTLLILMLLNVSAFAQSPGAIAVDVFDESTRRPVSDAQIVVTGRDGSTVTARTNKSGIAELAGLTPGL